ncbi:carbonic anhydrase [Sphingomonas lenta]|uniref:Carbonic anhydrase n=1 Tax=Sphingomonas lenta TaxID=1141887 RepID=A0A2A2SIZ7_9SPHN|nr:carbonic anhydrase [Sphingomonas lenta]PAX09199.1 carbonic anhydrase [Sphingomonas lenta]
MCTTHHPSAPALSRRSLVAGGLGLAALGVTSTAAARPAPVEAYEAAPVQNGKSALTPDQALQLLMDGNRRFLANELPQPDLSSQRRLELAKGQAPFVAYVSCSDSRVPPELLFGRGLGELFIIRNAGNTIDTVAQGSLEFAVAVLGVPLVVIMGHESCGAVKAAMDIVDKNARFPGRIGDMVEPIVPAVLEARGRAGDKLVNATKANVSRTVRRLRTESDPLLLRPQAEGRLKVVGAFYELGTGRVDFFDRPQAA